jgi:hypothetical protein
MTRALHKLTAATAKAKPAGKHSDGGGLWLYKRENGGAQWVPTALRLARLLRTVSPSSR